jgi:hypothetical protein
LILRGPNATIIRRWSPDTRLNGRSFTEAPLSAGDRLNIGSLEFEIVATGEIADDSPGADGFFPDRCQQFPTQSEPQKDLQLESDQLARLKAQWAEIESQRQTWNLQQQQWRAEQELSQQNLQNTERQLNERSVQLDSLAAELKIRKSQLDVQSAVFQSQNKGLADQAADLAAHAAENNSRSGELDARSVQLDARTAELQAQAAELAGRSVQLDAQAAELDMKTRELKKQAAELQSQSHNHQTRSAELESKLSELKLKKSELETKSSQLEIEHNQWEESRRAREQALASRQEEMDQKADRLETLQARLHAEMEDLQGQLAQRQRERELCEAEPTEQASDNGLLPSVKAPAADGSLPPQSHKSPADSHDILQRLDRDIDMPEETDNSATDETEALSNSQDPAAHEEESVDDYMVRLMQRIRSTQGDLSSGSDNPYASTAGRPDSAPLPLETTPAPAPVPVSAKRGEPVEMSPHTVAPEKQVDITLLRDLAKYSAQNALGTHDRRLMMHVMYSKLAVALLGGFTGMLLLFVWRMWFTNSLTFFSAMMSFVVAIIWGGQYVLLTIKLLVSGSDNLGSMQEFHQTSDDGKTPGERHAIFEIAGEKDTENPESPAEPIKAGKSSQGSDAADNYRYFKNV